MRVSDQDVISHQYSVAQPLQHSLHECQDALEFCRRFESLTAHPVSEIVHQVISSSAPQAAYLVGSVPLGMATPGSDVDFIVLIDSPSALVEGNAARAKNTDQGVAFTNDHNPTRWAEFLFGVNGITVDVTVALTAAVKGVYHRLRGRGPQLSESEIMTLSRISSGWLLWQSEEYLQQQGLRTSDPVLDVHCCVTHFVSALGFRNKALKALDLADIPLVLHLGRASVETAYLAYFASEGLSYLGAKWLALLGYARGAPERLARHPLLKEGVPLLFPGYGSESAQAEAYLQAASRFLGSMRKLIEQKTRYRIAFQACPLIHAI